MNDLNVGVGHRVAMRCRRVQLCRRRPLLLVALLLCLFYQTLMTARTRFFKTGSDPESVRNGSKQSDTREDYDKKTWREVLQSLSRVQTASSEKRALLFGYQHINEADFQLYKRIFARHGYLVTLARCTKKGCLQNQKQVVSSDWDILMCLPAAERSCLNEEEFNLLKPHQKVNMIPEIKEAINDKEKLCNFEILDRLPEAGLPIIHSVCGEVKVGPENASDHTEEKRSMGHVPLQSLTEQDMFSIIKVYVLITSFPPLTAFFHSTVLVINEVDKSSYAIKIHTYFENHFGMDASSHALDNMKKIISMMLIAAEMASQTSDRRVKTLTRCRLCFQPLTFTLGYNFTQIPVILKIHSEFDSEDLKDFRGDGQIKKEFIIEDALNFILPSTVDDGSLRNIFRQTSLAVGETAGDCVSIQSVCLTPEDIRFFSQFLKEVKNPGPFQLLYPSPSLQAHLSDFSASDQQQGGSSVTGRNVLLLWLIQELHSSEAKHFTDHLPGQGNHEPHQKRVPSSVPVGSENGWREQKDRCTLPYIKQIFTDPPLELKPQFDPKLKEYHVDVPFDMVTVWIRAEPINCHCQVHLDERRGPSAANYPVGLGINRINILVVDEFQPQPVIKSIYTLYIYRESRPTLPVFDDYVMCGFLQDCGLIVEPGKPCGLEPLVSNAQLHDKLQPCSAGDARGRWIVPCLSCSDNRTCDWREVSWQPEACYYPVPSKPEIQKCLARTKVLFIGDSTNRGMMYYLIERVNDTLGEWDKAHDTRLYQVNGNQTYTTYSYYPRFWLEKGERPTFEMALEELILRSRPLENTDRTVLVIGGVQWLNVNHLQILQNVLTRENLSNSLVVIKSIGMGFHLPVDGIRSLSLEAVQDLFQENGRILDAAKGNGYEVIDTFSITMGRYKEFLQGRCACHFHEVAKSALPQVSLYSQYMFSRYPAKGFSKLPQFQDFPSSSKSPYHVKGPINQVYSEILISRICSSKGRRST
ncbi:cadherin-like and PC-esterase domain-containing protein 1 [Erpetoichthys calabaricus]|uniref:cadherin-like and PC-esterase domain-containing protein 1 n=1 Tax=Erpetoichthys calabaricus TaxID=27687 RepID=UPI0010A09CE2|nr:cadherin-like and PC-esterase domain-containing protein 1 [Erpetoichthys calabaricus]